MITTRAFVVKQGQAAFARQCHKSQQFIFNRRFASKESTAISKLKASYPAVVTNGVLVNNVAEALAANNFGQTTTLVATSSGVLEEDFAKVYDTGFSMGDLAIFASGGVTSFGAMANLIPPEGDCLMVFGTQADAPEKELPLALYDEQKDLMDKIVAGGCQEVAADSKIAVLGGIQIIMPDEDYFLPVDFEIRDNQNNLVKTLNLKDYV